MKTIAVVIAYMDAGNQFRRRNLSAVISRVSELMPESKIVVSVQGDVPDCLTVYNERVTVVKNDIEGDFCKTRLLNVAVHNACSEYIMMVDADAYLDKDCVEYAWANKDSGALVFPYANVNYLDEADTRRLLSGNQLVHGDKNHGAQINRQTGLCNLFSMDTFMTIGGYDEEFTCWGAEDDAFARKCKRLAGNVVRNTSVGTVSHLFHPKVDNRDYRNGERYAMNRLMSACITRMSDADLLDYVSGKTTLGRLVDKYRGTGVLARDVVWKCTPIATLNIDATIYDIGSLDELTFTRVVEAVVAEDGPAYAVEFIDNILFAIPGIDVEQMEELKACRYRYAVRK